MGGRDKPTVERRLTILAIVVAGVLASVLGGGIFDLWDTAVGVTLLMLLRIYPCTEIDSLNEATAFAYTKALVWVMIFGVLVDIIVLAADDYLWGNSAEGIYKLFFMHGKPLDLGGVILLALWLLIGTVLRRKMKRQLEHARDI